ncbi:MAG: hypothetical protein U0Q11_17000 [Vicinamibacterales bacterium]
MMTKEQQRRQRIVIARRRFRAAEIEDALSFEKELALFRKEQREPGEVHLLFIDFDLREVGVVGEVRGQAPLRTPTSRVEAGVFREVVVDRWLHGRSLESPAMA